MDEVFTVPLVFHTDCTDCSDCPWTPLRWMRSLLSPWYSILIAQTAQTVRGLHSDSAWNFFGRTSCQFQIPSPSPVLVQSMDCLSKFIRTAQMLGLSMECFCILSADWSLMICADRSVCMCGQGPLHNLKKKLQHRESNPRHKTNHSKYF